MTGADASRCEQSARNAETHAFQCWDEVADLASRIPWDVLSEETTRPHAINDAEDVVEKPAGIVGASHWSGEAVGLTRVARSDAIHDATPRLWVEGGEVAPDRSRRKVSRFHARSQKLGLVGSPLDHTDCASAWACEFNSEVEGTGAGADGQQVVGFKLGT